MFCKQLLPSSCCLPRESHALVTVATHWIHFCLMSPSLHADMPSPQLAASLASCYSAPCLACLPLACKWPYAQSSNIG